MFIKFVSDQMILTWAYRNVPVVYLYPQAKQKTRNLLHVSEFTVFLTRALNLKSTQY